MATAKRLRELSQKGFVVNGLAIEDFLEVVIQVLASILDFSEYCFPLIINTCRFNIYCDATRRLLYRGLPVGPLKEFLKEQQL